MRGKRGRGSIGGRRVEHAKEGLQADEERLSLSFGHAAQDRRDELFGLAMDSAERPAPPLRKAQQDTATIAWVPETLHEVAGDQFVRYSSGEWRGQSQVRGKIGHCARARGAHRGERHHSRVRESESLARWSLLHSKMRRRVPEYRHETTEVFRVMRHGATKLPIRSK